MPRTTTASRAPRSGRRDPVPSGPRGPDHRPVVRAPAAPAPRSTPIDAELTDLREILPGTWLTTWHAPAIAAAARPGQYVHARVHAVGGLVLRLPVPIAATDPASGALSLEATGGGHDAWAAGARRIGDRVELLGPYGRPVELDPRSRHLLLIAEGEGIAGLRFVAHEAVRDGRSVVLLLGAGSAAGVHPSSLLPDEVEYVVATTDGSLGHRGSVVDLVTGYEGWADQAFAAGSTAMLSALARLAAGRRARLGVATLGRKRGGGRPVVPGTPQARRKAWLQVVLPQSIGCAAGTCLGCAVMGVSGVPLRVCREGPVFAADELDWPPEVPGS
jgi:dihydroorotate dehydrogenase electron transfer subunit